MIDAANGREGSEGKAQWSVSRRGNVITAKAAWPTSACRMGTGFSGADFFTAGMGQLSRLWQAPAIPARPRL
jgi:hypothetical protein